jgi:GTP-binding protein
VFDDDSEFLPEIREQANLALAEAAVAVVIADGQQGLTAADQSIAEWLRGQSCPVLLAVNKCESPTRAWPWRPSSGVWAWVSPDPVSAIHGAGTAELLDALLTHLPPTPEVEEEEPIQLAIIGRPNVGKSSLLNAVCGEKRAIVSPIRGTTRDTIDTTIEREGKRWKLLDTAGIRRRRSVDYGPEHFGINRSFKAIERCDVCALVIDVLDGVTEQDQRLAGRIEEEGRACVIVVNKWGRHREGQPHHGGDGRSCAPSSISSIGRRCCSPRPSPASGWRASLRLRLWLWSNIAAASARRW